MRRLVALVAALLLLSTGPTIAAPSEPLGYVGLLLIYQKEGVQKPAYLGFVHTKQECLDEGKKFVQAHMEEAAAAGLVLSVACVPIPPSPSPVPNTKEPSTPLGPSTQL